MMRDPLPHNEVLAPILLSDHLPQPRLEYIDQPGLQGVLFDVNLHQLRDVLVLFQDLFYRRIRFFCREGRALLLGPSATEDENEGCFAGEDGGCLALEVVFEEGLANEVGEVHGAFGFEEARWSEEGFAAVVVEVCDVAEIWPGPRFRSVTKRFNGSAAKKGFPQTSR